MFRIITKRISGNIVETETTYIDDVSKAFDYFELQQLMAKGDVILAEANSVTVSLVDADGEEFKSVSYETL